MKKLIILILLLSAISTITMAQSVIVSGTVIDKENDEVLSGAALLVKDTQVGVITDAEGQFEIDLPDKNQTVLTKIAGPRY